MVEYLWACYQGAHVTEREWFEKLVDPRSVALVGASDNPNHLAGKIQYFLKKWGYAGDVYPINPGRELVQGFPAFDNVKAVPGPVDVAIVVLPAPLVPKAVAECAEIGAGVVIIGSAGFGETSPQGAEIEESMRSVCRKANVRMIGPNC